MNLIKTHQCLKSKPQLLKKFKIKCSSLSSKTCKKQQNHNTWQKRRLLWGLRLLILRVEWINRCPKKSLKGSSKRTKNGSEWCCPRSLRLTIFRNCWALMLVILRIFQILIVSWNKRFTSWSLHVKTEWTFIRKRMAKTSV